MLEDKILVCKCRYGNEEALCRIYIKYKDLMLTLAKGMLMDQAEAEDVVHDVFVRFAESVSRFRLTGSLKGYLATCVANRARDRIRVRNRQPEMDVSAGSRVPTVDDPGQNAMAHEEIVRLQQALTQIPPEQREAVLLHQKAGLTFREIAAQMGVSISTVHGRYRYGLDKLRTLLTPPSGGS
jgi:RNA polymerase sigma-70 factor (ECF subfamily)